MFANVILSSPRENYSKLTLISQCRTDKIFFLGGEGVPAFWLVLHYNKCYMEIQTMHTIIVSNLHAYLLNIFCEVKST